MTLTAVVDHGHLVAPFGQILERRLMVVDGRLHDTDGESRKDGARV